MGTSTFETFATISWRYPASERKRFAESRRDMSGAEGPPRLTALVSAHVARPVLTPSMLSSCAVWSGRHARMTITFLGAETPPEDSPAPSATACACRRVLGCGDSRNIRMRSEKMARASGPGGAKRVPALPAVGRDFCLSGLAATADSDPTRLVGPSAASLAVSKSAMSSVPGGHCSTRRWRSSSSPMRSPSASAVVSVSLSRRDSSRPSPWDTVRSGTRVECPAKKKKRLSVLRAPPSSHASCTRRLLHVGWRLMRDSDKLSTRTSLGANPNCCVNIAVTLSTSPSHPVSPSRWTETRSARFRPVFCDLGVKASRGGWYAPFGLYHSHFP
mmetsp:Transcript_25573/g.84178  ORF Transcript_25573/g.84178 Transcript_25573/m.84178 type:complete len:331 (-) Transcript_25573:67-1059(-)